MAARRLLVLIAIGALAAITGCSANTGLGNGNGPGATAGPSNAVKTKANGYPAEICALVPKSTVDAAFGVTFQPATVGDFTCSYQTAEGLKYEYSVYPGQSTFGTFALFGSNPTFQKVDGVGQEAIFVREVGATSVTLAFRTSKWTGVTKADGPGIDANAATVAKLKAADAALATALGT